MNQRLREAVRFAYPVRPWRLTKIDAGLVDENYYRLFGQWHRGIDVNGVYGGDTDLGLPVQSMFPGVVLGVVNAPGWGHTVLIRAEPWVRDLVASAIEADVEELEVQYTHLHQVTVVQGDQVNAGSHLGSIGKGDRSQFVAHLHLEVRRVALPAVVPQAGTQLARDTVLEQCLDPLYLFSKLSFDDFGNTIAYGRQVAPVVDLTHNRKHVPGNHLVSVDRRADSLVFEDDRVPEPEVEPPSSLWVAILQTIQRWFAGRT